MKAIILVGSRDFGRCPIASRLPTALWPVAGKPVLENLLVHLANQGIEQVTVCSAGEGSLLAESIRADDRLNVVFLDGKLPTGTAGSIRDAAKDESDGLLLVLPASIVNPPRIEGLITAHRDGHSELTIMFNPGPGDGRQMAESADIYVCETSILKHIPKGGYFDIKEGLIPAMLRAGKTIHGAVLPNHAGNFRDRQGYIDAIAGYIENAKQAHNKQKPARRTGSQSVRIAPDATVDPSARIYGPVAIMDGARVSEGVVILGPTAVGSNVRIGSNSVVANSVIWDGAQIGENCHIQQCLIDRNARVRRRTVAAEKSVPLEAEGMWEALVSGASEIVSSSAGKLQRMLRAQADRINAILPSWVRSHKARVLPWLGPVIVLIAFLWCYWSGIADLWKIWQRSDEYSSGLLVPFLAVYVLWSRRYDLAQCTIKPCILWGLLVFLTAQAGRLFGLFFLYSSAENLSLVLCVASLVLLLCGRQLFRKVFTVLVFLGLMLPWPTRIQAAIALPLQRWATSSSVFCLETIGYNVRQEGNLIDIGGATVAVAEACNGLRMITAFFVISGLVVLLVKRAWWKKLVILASSLPIALLCNTVRLTLTAMAFTVLQGKYWEKVFHDFGGYAMMPLALAIVVVELWLLAKLTTLPTKEEAVIITRRSDNQHRRI